MKFLTPNQVPKEYRELAKLAKQQHWAITRTGSNHLAWHPPHGHVVHTPSTPSTNGTGIIRIRSKLKKAGLVI